MSPEAEREGVSDIMDVMMKVDHDIEQERAPVDSDSERDISSSNDTGLSPSTDVSSSRRTGTGRDDDSSTGLSIAHTENKAVMLWKIVVVLVMLASTVGVAVIVFLYLSREEQSEFEAAFSSDSNKVFEAIGNALDIKLGAVDAFVTSIVSFAKATNQTWPFVTVADFPTRAAKVRSLSHAMSISQLQIVWNDVDRKVWEDSYVEQNDGWVKEAIETQRTDPSFDGDTSNTDYEPHDHTDIWFGHHDDIVPYNSSPYAPSWQSYPVFPSFETPPYNSDLMMSPKRGSGIKSAISSHEVVISRVLNLINTEDPASPEYVRSVNEWNAKHVGPGSNPNEPLVQFLYPILVDNDDLDQDRIYQDHSDNTTEVGIMATSFFWKSFIQDTLPEGQNGIVTVFHNECGQSFTYSIDGADTSYMGEGDLHDPQYDNMGVTLKVSEVVSFTSDATTYSGLPLTEDYCAYSISIYPSPVFEDKYKSWDPVIFTIAAVSIFAFTALVFIAYDKLVAVRQAKVMKSAVQSSAIVSSLFPSKIRDRLYQDAIVSNNKGSGNGSSYQPSKARLKSFLREGNDEFGGTDGPSKPIADLFTDCTVMFADIANFTAWSSAREPCQVFTLLETVYGAFDKIAAHRNVFKVETIGDCYVAVTGLPEPKKDHAVVMAKFAKDCRDQFAEVTRMLEVSLGPDTSELGLRVGLHSGAVTAGVLRGQKSRFQLFGDTVNTAARMESTGTVNRIHISQSTAALLEHAKKGHWLKLREDKIQAKGKGLLQTYFVEPKSNYSGSKGSSEKAREDAQLQSGALSTKIIRLVTWNVDVLSKVLVKVIQARESRGQSQNKWDVEWMEPSDCMVIQEVKEIILLPAFDPSVQISEGNFKLEEVVTEQLHDYVLSIAKMYTSNPFHNFEHASHVTMSVAKLLTRIVAPDQVYNEGNENDLGIASTLHDQTYGITSDPLTQFACIFSALIHDCDHPGVPNSQLVMENTEVSQMYQGKSVAEQNSVNLAWDLLKEQKYEALRSAICGSQEEELRFRQLVVNAVMATDIMDKDLKKLRDDRWDAAFQKESVLNDTLQINRKATIVIEHLIQASDVAHTMQHWHVFRKWNERLFQEMFCAYQEGRAETNPIDFWYQGELGFFDFYIIPLAKKLSECGVFGVSSDEYLTYATENRREWEKKGKSIVAGYIEKLEFMKANGKI